MRQRTTNIHSPQGKSAFEDRAVPIALALGILAWCAVPLASSAMSGCAIAAGAAAGGAAGYAAGHHAGEEEAEETIYEHDDD